MALVKQGVVAGHDIRSELDAAIGGSMLYTPRDDVVAAAAAAAAAAASKRAGDRGGAACVIEVTDETTLAAARRLAAAGLSAVALVFASARNPGGGFLNGAQAQEESCARGSALYACQTTRQGAAFYEANRAGTSCLYSDHAIWSPRVPVFRDDADALTAPALVSFITSPAPNAGVERSRGTGEGAIRDALVGRERIIAIAALHGHASIVLGAFGCGVFKNDPSVVAEVFHAALMTPGLQVRVRARRVCGPRRGVAHRAFAARFGAAGST